MGQKVNPHGLRVGVIKDWDSRWYAEADFADGKMDILTVLVKAGLVSSRSEARRAVQQGGVAVDGEKVTDIATTYEPASFDGDGVIVKKGKKNFRRVVVK